MPALDRGLGAVPSGGSILIRHDPTVEALPFLMQSAAEHIAAGREVVFVVTGRKPSRLKQAMDDLAGPVDHRRLFVVDAHSALMGDREPTAYPVPHPAGAEAIVAAVEKAVKEHPGCVVMVESLSTLIDRSSHATFRELLPRLLAAARKSTFLAAIFTSWPYEQETVEALGRFDAMVQLRGVEERVILHQSLAVERTPWAEPHPPTLYKVNRPGGVLAYIPKVVVLGPHGAGKTTFVHAVSDKAMSVERMGTTVAMDRGTATLEGVRCEVFGTPGQERFDPLLPTLAAQAVAAILLVDATRPDTFPRAREMLQKIWRRGLVVTIALNKSDLKGALKPTEARGVLAAPVDVELVPCISTEPASARKVLSRLVDQVLDGRARR